MKAADNGDSGKKHATYRLSSECLEILNRRAKDKGLTRTAVIENAVRDYDRMMDRLDRLKPQKKRRAKAGKV
jgi:hypothetical protein